jgi:thiol:disulfide interchange protein DsbA
MQGNLRRPAKLAAREKLLESVRTTTAQPSQLDVLQDRSRLNPLRLEIRSGGLPLRGLAALSVVAVAPPARAAGVPLREGIDFVRISRPLPQSQPGIEVIEFFSYGCPHCHEFEPAVTKWRSTLPKDVRFRRVPISFGNPKWEALAKLYRTIDGTGDLAKMDGAGFSAVHDQKLPLANDKAVIDWAVKHVADPKKFTDMYQSFGIQTMARSAEQTGAEFGITGSLTHAAHDSPTTHQRRMALELPQLVIAAGGFSPLLRRR